jgi:hypothetical protein
MRRSVVASVAALLLLPAAIESQNMGAGRLRAGAHKIDITPQQSDLQLATAKRSSGRASTCACSDHRSILRRVTRCCRTPPWVWV